MKYLILIISLTLNLTCFAQLKIDFKNNNAILISPTNFPEEMLKYSNNRITINIGTVNYGAKNCTYDFDVTNLNSEPFIFDRVSWGEPSFAPKWTKEPTVSGKKAKLSYGHWDTKRIGPFYKSSWVKTNFGQFYVSFRGYNLPPEVAINKTYSKCIATLGDTIKATFKIYNKSDTSFLTLSRMSSDFHTYVTCDNQNETSIPPNSYRTFYVQYIPRKTGNLISQIEVNLNNAPIQYYLYCNVQKPITKDKSH